MKKLLLSFVLISLSITGCSSPENHYIRKISTTSTPTSHPTPTDTPTVKPFVETTNSPPPIIVETVNPFVEETMEPEPPMDNIVTAGAFCSTLGTQGVTKTGKHMTCKPSATDSRKRWRAS